MNSTSNEQLTLPGGAKYGFDDIARADEKTLAELMRRGTMPDMKSIAGWEFRGRNISVISKLLNLRRFFKGFREVPEGVDEPEMLDGYNLWARQHRGLDKPWEPVEKEYGTAERHGFFKAHPVDAESIDNRHPNAILIDYTLAKNPFYRPDGVLRDYFVQAYPDNPDLYVGEVTAPLGDLRVPGGYFVMERFRRGGGQKNS